MAQRETPRLPEPGRHRRIPDRRLAALGPLPRRDAPPRRPVRGARRRARAERPRLQGRARPRRPHPRPPGQLPPRPHRPARGRRRSTRAKRPFVIVDPRAGHGPGIGGFKADSEIGVAMKAGHPAYFIGFLPDAEPGQTILDIAAAEAVFLETVIARHPEAEGKPCVIGNCQAGWAVMIVAALRPELFGPIIIAGTPLSYWAGVRGREPDALLRRPARRLLADRARRRPRRRHLRRRGAGAELREPEPRQHPLDQAVQPLVARSTPSPSATSSSRSGGAATSP